MASKPNESFVERYQILYEKDPSSKVFAPLAEAYRKRGLFEKAEELCLKGVSLHPHFTSGHMALARVYLDQGKFNEAIQELKVVVELSPENLLAHRLLGETYLKTSNPREGLRALKMVLFLNPDDAAARNQIQRLESLTAEDYDEDVFEMKGLSLTSDEMDPELIKPIANVEDTHATQSSLPVAKKQRYLERVLSLADAFIVRNDADKAMKTLTDAENTMGEHPEISKRLQFLQKRGDAITSGENISVSTSPSPQVVFLEGLLEKIEARRRV